MSEMEMNKEVEIEEFTDELFDEALDRDEGEGKLPVTLITWCR